MRGGDRDLLLSAERFEECRVGGDQFMKRLPGDLAALRGEPDERPAAVGRLGGRMSPARSSRSSREVMAAVAIREDRAWPICWQNKEDLR